ncbi:hypothetical protein PN36_16185 [Candidatus Thiomargarita nelsonii]|uniref:4Fe4S-binding SPASM domain-containing protein n=1 Tax=Candidatus Thiomargarita nelsonii TaxID=1003181 RepID=A0A0A6PBB8_9GAMM|nr:hypothetical protein PN36_16185 [Candidatus Thiomargarita nelsonii]
MNNLTFFTIPQAFEAQSDWMQWNAIKSWTLLKPKPDILLLGNAPSVASIASELGLYHVPNVDQKHYSSITDIAKWLDRFINNTILVYVNPNVVLTEDFTQTIQEVYNNQDHFLLTGQYRTVQTAGVIDFNNNQWQHQLRVMADKQAMPQGQLQNLYLVFTKQLLKQLFVLDPNVEYSWEKQLFYAALRKYYPIIDGSQIITPFLQTSKKRVQTNPYATIVHDIIHLTQEKRQTKPGLSNEDIVNYISELLTQKYQLSLAEQYETIPFLIKNHAQEKFAFLFAAKLAYEQDKIDEAFSYVQPAVALNERDLYAQRLLNQIKLRLGLPAWSEQDEKELSQRFCIQPFNRLETRYDGNVFTCCMGWLSTPIGNINNDSPDKIWNSEIAQKIRKSILEGSFAYCSRSKCPKIINKSLPFKKDITSKFERNIIDHQITVMSIKPQEIKLNHDRSCNLACPSCRAKPYRAKGEMRTHLAEIADTVILPLLKNANIVEITGSGDAFGSEHFRYILKQINAQTFPHLKIDLFTNGVLFDEKSWHQLGLQGLCRRAVISIDATLEKTYNILRKGGDFKRLLQNLEFISGLRQQGNLTRVVLVFIVQKENFLQIPDFISLTKKLNFDQAFFQMIAPWSQSIEEYEDKNVGFSKHPLHQDFLQVLRDPLLQDQIVFLGTMKPFYDEALQSTFDKNEIGYIRTESDNPKQLDTSSQQLQQTLKKKRTERLMPSSHQYDVTISEAKKFIWFRVPKVASRTIYDHLREQVMPLECEHPSRIDYPVNLYKNYFKFAFVRNPWDRLVSCWYNKVIDDNAFKFNETEHANLQQFEYFVNYVASLNIENCDPHFRLQSRLIDLNWIDYIGRFENFEEDYSLVCQKLGLSLNHLTHRNPSSKTKKHYREFYTKALRDKVYKIYLKDIQTFGYQF